MNAKHQAILTKMQQDPANKTCADCHGPAARWASINLGCFLCIGCSGVHRKLGVHISVVRSITLDTWTPGQVAQFVELGNVKSASVYEANLPPNFRRPSSSDAINLERFIRDKYERKLFTSVENGGPNPNRRGSTYHDRRSDSARSSGTAAPTSAGIAHDAHGPKPGQAVDRVPMSSGYATRDTPRSARASASTPYQRANSMRQMLEMGFAPHTAARALDATRGNLEQAVEWVLQHDGSVRGLPERPREDFGSTRPSADAHRPTPSLSQPVSKPVDAQVDLLTFDEEPVADKPKAAPAYMGTQPIKTPVQEPLSRTAMEPSNRSKATAAAPPAWAAVDDDFADFGAFESALPSSPTPREKPSSSKQVPAQGATSSVGTTDTNRQGQADGFASQVKSNAGLATTVLQNVGSMPTARASTQSTTTSNLGDSGTTQSALPMGSPQSRPAQPAVAPEPVKEAPATVTSTPADDPFAGLTSLAIAQSFSKPSRVAEDRKRETRSTSAEDGSSAPITKTREPASVDTQQITKKDPVQAVGAATDNAAESKATESLLFDIPEVTAEAPASTDKATLSLEDLLGV